MKVHAAMPVWGDRYIDLLEQVSLPSLLAPGNLPVIAASHDCRIRLLTRPEDLGRLEASAVVQRAKDVCAVEFSVDHSEESGGKYAGMNARVAAAIDDAISEGAALTIALADMVWSDGLLAEAASRVSTGRQAVLAPCPRVVADKFLGELGTGGDWELAESGLSFSPRRLADLTLRHLHPYNALCFWGGERFHDWPYIIHWAVKGGGMLSRAVHLHPVMMRPEAPQRAGGGEIDGALIFDVCLSSEGFDIISDSDQGVFVSLEAFAQASLNFEEYETERDAIIGVALWMHRHVDRRNLIALDTPCRLHTGGISDSAWAVAAMESEHIVHRIRFALAVIDLANELTREGFDTAAKKLAHALFTSEIADSMDREKVSRLLADNDADIQALSKDYFEEGG